MSDFGINHPTVEPPTPEQQAKDRPQKALDVLERLNREWENVTETDKRRSVRHAIAVLNND